MMARSEFLSWKLDTTFMDVFLHLIQMGLNLCRRISRVRPNKAGRNRATLRKCQYNKQPLDTIKLGRTCEWDIHIIQGKKAQHWSDLDSGTLKIPLSCWLGYIQGNGGAGI